MTSSISVATAVCLTHSRCTTDSNDIGRHCHCCLWYVLFHLNIHACLVATIGVMAAVSSAPVHAYMLRQGYLHMLRAPLTAPDVGAGVMQAKAG